MATVRDMSRDMAFQARQYLDEAARAASHRAGPAGGPSILPAGRPTPIRSFSASTRACIASNRAALTSPSSSATWYVRAPSQLHRTNPTTTTNPFAALLVIRDIPRIDRTPGTAGRIPPRASVARKPGVCVSPRTPWVSGRLRQWQGARGEVISGRQRRLR
jgi:hypothetical protein